MAMTSSDCNGDAMTACKINLAECVQWSGGSAAAVCDCMGEFDGCLQDAGCPAAVVQAAIQQCEAKGCSADVCTEGDKVSQNKACDSDLQTACKINLSECIAHSGGSASIVCDCRGEYDACLKHGGCPASMVQAAVQQCESSGCRADVCTEDSLSSGSCDEAGLAPCATALSTCIMNSGGDPTAMCNCRGQYDTCYQNAGCPAAAVQAVVQGCVMSGCTQQQCAPSK
jgi:hypothetical protein